jgi:hypothetical protein
VLVSELEQADALVDGVEVDLRELEREPGAKVVELDGVFDAGGGSLDDRLEPIWCAGVRLGSYDAASSRVARRWCVIVADSARVRAPSATRPRDALRG